MPPLTVRPVTSRSEQRRFVRLPWRIYAQSRHWVPPLTQSFERLVGFRPHPFHERPETRSFLASRGGVDVGRITAIVNHAHKERYDERRGFFGFFECDDDSAAAAELFTVARDWLAARGMTAIRGPANPSLNYECGLLVEGFDLAPQMMMTYNQPWYDRLG